MTAVRLLDIRDAPLSLDEVYAAVADPAAGGICVFIGTVRDHDEGQGVSALGYSSHPTALARLRDVAERIADECEVVALAGRDADEREDHEPGQPDRIGAGQHAFQPRSRPLVLRRRYQPVQH